MARKRFSERKEGWFRIIVAFVSGIILAVWGKLIGLVSVISWLIAIFSGKRNKSLAEFCEPWNTERYKFLRYMTFVSNKRPFPFSKIERISKYK
jgi:hypothetical protein